MKIFFQTELKVKLCNLFKLLVEIKENSVKTKSIAQEMSIISESMWKNGSQSLATETWRFSVVPISLV